MLDNMRQPRNSDVDLSMKPPLPPEAKRPLSPMVSRSRRMSRHQSPPRHHSPPWFHPIKSNPVIHESEERMIPVVKVRTTLEMRSDYFMLLTFRTNLRILLRMKKRLSQSFRIRVILHHPDLPHQLHHHHLHLHFLTNCGSPASLPDQCQCPASVSCSGRRVRMSQCPPQDQSHSNLSDQRLQPTT